MRAAAETNTPVLIQVSMGAAKYMGGYKFVKDMVEDQMDAMEIKVPVIWILIMVTMMQRLNALT